MAFTRLEELDYEGTLRALQEHVGSRVAVSFGGEGTEWVGGSILGPLHSANEADLGALPILEGRFAGESIQFTVGEPMHPQTLGGFGIWRNGFSWGRRVDGSTGAAIHFCVDGVTVRVMPIPHGMLPVDAQ